MSNKILMIVNEFPPIAESGVQRPLKFLKYLDRDGWDTFVITPRKLVKLTTDKSLIDEVPASARIYRTPSLGISAGSEEKFTEKRSEFLSAQSILKRLSWKMLKVVNDFVMPIDKQIGWVPFATWKAVRLICKYKIRNVYITAFPYSAFVCGLILKRIFGRRIFWIADYRDAWQFSPMLEQNVHPFRFRYLCKMDERVLAKSDHVLFTSPLVEDLYLAKYAWLAGKSDVITNGYDEADFTGLRPKVFDKFTFMYMGKIFTTKGNPLPLLNALRQYMQGDFQYLHIGTIGKLMHKQIETADFGFFHFLGYKPHSEAIAYSAGADVNIIIINNDIYSKGVIPGKLFELLRIGKPILLIGPHQKLINDLLTKTGLGVSVHSDKVEEIVAALRRLLSEQSKSTLDMHEIEQYSRKNLTARLEAIYQNNPQ